MRRVYFLFATSSTVDLDDLPEGVTVGDFEMGNGPCIRLPGLEYPESDLMVRSCGSRQLGGQTWRLWFVMPVSQDWRQGARVARFIRRVALARPAKVRGPWSLKQLAELFPAVADAVLYPHRYDFDGTDLGKVPGAPLQTPDALCSGDTLAAPGVDYRPSDEDATNDTEPDPGDLFPVEAGP